MAGPIKEVDAISDFGLTLDHFYSIIKKQVGELQANQYVQLQLTALPLDVSKDYTWFSYNNITQYFDVRLTPSPATNSLVLSPGAKLSGEFQTMCGLALTLVEAAALDPDTVKQIDSYQAEIDNLENSIDQLEANLLNRWAAHCSSTMADRGDLAEFTHWSQGEPATAQVYQFRQEAMRKLALQQALRDKQYADPNQKEIADAFGRILSSSSRIRYPRFPDSEYGDEAKKFNAVYFASLADNSSALFTNNFLFTPNQSLANITGSTIGSLSEKIEKHSEANDRMTEDWGASGSVGYGPFSLKADVASHTAIQEDFKHLETITVGARSFLAIKMNPGDWFSPGIFDNPIIAKNRRLFERFLGGSGSLLYYPTHLIVARGMSLKFSSSQDWNYDYEHSFSTSGSASASVFGINFGGGGHYGKTEEHQKVERRGHDLVMDDGEQNIRILGYIATKNKAFMDFQIAQFGRALEDVQTQFTAVVRR